ncbi:MAG: late transcription factor VLTF3-like protein [Homavirus sp.]|uniref:Late transcription factor VLTF3-like protein n=1 Tax=Homavirus sp. TaxID=2487769 RepID=A0A3G5A6Z1_9VIRU|nr:MAG: late transcription factor VLTF3-like protein [Homavirus sp.]
MSTFRLKNDKPKYVTEIKTLDETHKKIVNEFQKRKRMLPKKKNHLIELQHKLKLIEIKNGSEYTNDDIKTRSKLKSDIKSIEEEIYDIENNISEIDYYSKTNELLMDYYDILDEDDDHIYQQHPELSELKQDVNTSEKLDVLDKLNIINKRNKKPKKITRRRKRKNDDNGMNNIMNYLGNTPVNTTTTSTNTTGNATTTTNATSTTNTNATTNANATSTHTSNEISITQPIQINTDFVVKNIQLKDRSELLDHFRMLIDNEYLCEKNKNKNIIRKCEECNMDKTLNQAEGSYVCQNCGISEMIIIESEIPNYKDVVPDKPGYPYKRINHFNEWLSQFQAKESTEIPKEIYDLILTELHKQKFYDLKRLTLPQMKKILKKLGITQQYEHTTHIISKLSGLPPPTINRETEEELRKMFKMIQLPFEKHCPKARINFLSYSYVLHKFCQLLELDDFIKCFPLLKSREKLRQQDKIWQAICRELKWQFIPSI